jgi:exodeoxyribonuclease-1
MALVRATEPNELSNLKLLADQRLIDLLPLYKARNFPQALTTEERTAWDSFCPRKLQSGDKNSRLATFASRLQALGESPQLSDAQRYLLEELQLYAESIVVLED